LYDQNNRHTEGVLVDVEGAKPKPPLFITDTVSIPAVYFENNSAALKGRFKTKLDSISENLSKRKLSKIEIIGHTDSVGTLAKNLDLSLSRAVTLREYLVSKLPQYREIMFVSGKGMAQPIASNATETGRAKNRRVEIILTLQVKGN
jgi:OOP family OmpA-OmpF porin